MLGKYVGDKCVCNINSSSVISGRYENTLLGEVVDDYKDCSVAIQRWELLNKVVKHHPEPRRGELTAEG